MADVFENEAPLIRLDQPATVSLAYGRGKSFRAKVSYIQPQVDPMTRTLKVRLEAENSEMLLRPDMYAEWNSASGCRAVSRSPPRPF